MNQQQSVSSDNNGWISDKDTQTHNTRYYPHHSNNQKPVSNSITNMVMDPSYSYGYSMHDKVNNQEITNIDILVTDTL